MSKGRGKRAAIAEWSADGEHSRSMNSDGFGREHNEEGRHTQNELGIVNREMHNRQNWCAVFTSVIVRPSPTHYPWFLLPMQS